MTVGQVAMTVGQVAMINSRRGKGCGVISEQAELFVLSPKKKDW